MDEAFFLFAFISGLFLLCSIIWCFLSTCLGIQIRRSDLVEAFTLPTPARIRARDAERRRAAAAGGYELDDLAAGDGYGSERRGGGAGGLGGLGGVEELEMLRRSGAGPGRGGFY